MVYNGILAITVIVTLMNVCVCICVPVGTRLLIVATLTVRGTMDTASPALQAISDLFTVHKMVPLLTSEGAQSFINAKKMHQ